MPAKILLIRHGLTELNLKKRYCGSLDVCLHDTGRKQAESLREKLLFEKIDRIYSSPKIRALETSRILFGKRRINKIPDLREIGFGCFEGLTHKEIMRRHPEIYEKWLKDPFNAAIPKAETLENFKKRVIKAIGKIAHENSDKTVAVVCHGGVIGVINMHLRKKNDFWRLIPKPASVTILNYG